MPTVAGDLRHTARLRRQVAERERSIYGALLEDVLFLRRRGFSIHAELKGSRRFYRVGNRLLGPGQLRETAARERRLLQPLPQLPLSTPT